MANQFLRQIVPLPQPEAEILELYQDTREFYREMQHRQALDEYCQWYYQLADQNRRDLETMRSEINFMEWFRRNSRQ